MHAKYNYTGSHVLSMRAATMAQEGPTLHYYVCVNSLTSNRKMLVAIYE